MLFGNEVIIPERLTRSKQSLNRGCALTALTACLLLVFPDGTILETVGPK